MTNSSKAFELFLKREYKAALNIYEEIKINLKTNAFDYQINISIKKLAESTNHNKDKISENNAIEEPQKRSDNHNKLCFIRIIGNDLPGLHAEEQSYINLKFILENEVEYNGVDKIFLLNRIVSSEKRIKIKKLLNEYKKKYFEQVFDKEEYIKINLTDEDLPKEKKWIEKELSEWELICIKTAQRKNRNKYLMNNNGARNFAIDYGIKNGYDWIFPTDGNCFLSEIQFQEIFEEINEVKKEIIYLIVPMERCLHNAENLRYARSDNPNEEPQILFSKNSKLRFDNKRVYGNQPKVELLKRLGVPGIWDNWAKEYPWKDMEVQVDEHNKKSWIFTSSIFRLSSGNSDSALSSKIRSNTRSNSIACFCDEIFDYCNESLLNKTKLDYTFYRTIKLDKTIKSREAFTVNSIFDKIYLVSLSSDRDKRYKTTAILRQHEIDFHYFEAIDGYTSEGQIWFHEYKKKPIGSMVHFSEFNDYEISRNSKLIESPGAAGYVKTYINILKNAKDNKYKRILILEDDIILSSNFKNRLKSFLEKIDNNWKLIQLGASQYGWSSIKFDHALKQGFYYPSIHETKGSFAIGVDSSIYDEIISEQEHMEAPFDNLPMGVIYEKYKKQCFVAFPNLIMPDVARSGIRDPRNQYEHANRVKWWVGDFSYPREKLRVGVIISSIKSLKYISIFDFKKLPYQLNIYYCSENGLAPIHEFHELPGKLFDFKSANINKIILENDINLYLKHDFVINEEVFQEILDSWVSNGKIISEACVVVQNDSNIKKSLGRVSVIIPTYKRPLNLEKAIVSVLNQDYENIELIIVNDNGMDSTFNVETEEVINRIFKKYPSRLIKYIRHLHNANGAFARNTGILHSTGEYISFLDDDDIYLDKRISESVNLLRYTNDDIGAVYCGFIGWNSNEIDFTRFPSGNLTKELLTLDYKKHYIHTNTVTYKRSAVFSINGFDVTYRRHQDLEFNLRFFQKYSMISLEKVLVHLAPLKSDIDNKIYGYALLELKIKFLKKFKELISTFDDNVVETIYKNHWAEVFNYFKDKTVLVKEFNGFFDNGPLQLLLMATRKNEKM